MLRSNYCLCKKTYVEYSWVNDELKSGSPSFCSYCNVAFSGYSFSDFIFTALIVNPFISIVLAVIHSIAILNEELKLILDILSFAFFLYIYIIYYNKPKRRLKIK